MKALAAAFLLLASTAALADDFWFAVLIDSNPADAIEGQPADLRVAVACLACLSPTVPIDFPLSPTDTVIWSFGDGSPDLTVIGSPHVTHTFPRGWFNVTAQVDGHTIRTRIFSAPKFIDPPSYVTVSTPIACSEGAGACTIQLTRSGNLGTSSTIGFSVDSAPPWLTSTNGTVTFAPGETSKSIVLGLIDDAIFEGRRGFQLMIWSADGATLQNVRPLPQYVARMNVSVDVNDDEPPPNVRVDDVVVSEGNAGLKPAVFVVKLSAPAAIDLFFSFDITGGTATPGQDYLRPETSSITIPAGATSGTFTIPIVGDRTQEPDEVIRLQITSAYLGNNPFIVNCVIVNDDFPTRRRSTH